MRASQRRLENPALSTVSDKTAKRYREPPARFTAARRDARFETDARLGAFAELPQIRGAVDALSRAEATMKHTAAVMMAAGLGLIALHVGNQVLLRLPFPEYQLLVLIYFVNLPRLLW